MRFNRHLGWLLATVPTILIACGENPTAPSTNPAPALAVSDGVNAGNPHFFFLPPLVAPPKSSGTFDPTLHPEVRVCPLPACDRDLATFLTGSGPDQVSLDAGEQAYRINWHTRNARLVPGAGYRIRVYVGPQLLGFLDVQVTPKQGRPPAVPAGFVALRWQHPLLIRFRIELGALTQRQEKIAFLSLRDGNIEIYSMNPDGSDQTRLTNNPTYDHSAAWSPDGRKIAFVSLRDGNDDIYVMNADGTGVTNLTNTTATRNDPIYNHSPAWSPDGSRIAFSSQRNGVAGIWIMTADGTSQTRLTTQGEDRPAWSPDGRKIAVVWQRVDVELARSVSSIIVMNPEGANPAPVEIFRTIVACPDYLDWSPDGSTIAFADCVNGSIQLINPDGSGLRQLPVGGNTGHASWSPDGSRLAFWSDRAANEGGLSEVYTMRRDGTDIVRLTFNPSFDFDPVWSP